MEAFIGSALVIRAVVSWHKMLRHAEKVEIHTSHSDSTKETKLDVLAKDVICSVPYHPTLYSVLDHHGQLQTAGQYFLRNLTRFLTFLVPFSPLLVNFDRELLTLSDGGVVAIDWASQIGVEELPDDAPVMILHHGLVGDSQSEYIYHFLRRLRRAGYRAGVMIARGCGGLQLHNAFTFAGRKTADIRHVILHVKSRYPTAKLFWTAFSLGAAGTLQYLEDFHDEGDSLLDAAMCVSPPWSFQLSSTAFNFWSMIMVIPMKLYMLRHNHVFLEEFQRHALPLYRLLTLNDLSSLNETCFFSFGGITPSGESVLLQREKERNASQRQLRVENRSNSMRTGGEESSPLSILPVSETVDDDSGSGTDDDNSDNDEDMSPSPLNHARRKELLHRHGTLQYENVQQYYDDCSPLHRAHLITTPTLAVSAKDDPICPHQNCPRSSRREIGPGLIVVKTQVGGHLAFPEGLLPLTHAWTDRLAMEWFERFR